MTATARYDAAVIGGGLAGTATALALRRRGLSVALFERGHCGAQASGVNFGGVRRQGRASVQLPLAQRAHQIWARLPEIIGSGGEFVRSGHLKLARSGDDMCALESYARENAEAGLELELLDRAAVRDRYPWLGSSVHGASLCPGDGHANPRLVAAGFAQAARRAGVAVSEFTPIEHVNHVNGTFEISNGERPLAQAPILVNCAGAWADRIADWAGEAVPLGRIYPSIIATAALPPILTVNIGVQGGGVYARQVARGNCIIGGARARPLPDPDHSRPIGAGLVTMIASATKLFPALARAQVIRAWSGTEAETPDHQPIIGPSATKPGLLHGFGFSGAGFQITPAVGEVLAELACDGRTTTPIDAFSIERFRTSPQTNHVTAGGISDDDI